MDNSWSNNNKLLAVATQSILYNIKGEESTENSEHLRFSDKNNII